MNEVLTCNSEGEAVSAAWDAFIETIPDATIAHIYGWSRIVSEAYGHRPYYLSAWRDGALVGVLPLVYIKSHLFGNSLTSMPFHDYGGIVAKDEAAFQFLLGEALRLRDELRVSCLELRFREEPPLPGGRPHGNKEILLLDMSGGAENLWKSFSPKVRNQVRKAQKSGLSTEIGGSELLEEFYRPFSVNMRDLGSPVHHLKFFERIFAVLGDRVHVALVREGKQAIGGLIVFFYNGTAVVPWASCYRHYFPKCPNNLLYWDTMRYACEHGCGSFDFGRSSPGSGTYNFKSQWGARALPMSWRIYAKTEIGVSSESPVMKLASKAWRHIPVSITRQVGPSIRRFLTN